MKTSKEFPKDDLAEALRAITSLIGKLAKVQKKLPKGTPQYTLTKNRLKAFRIASALINKEMTASGASRKTKS